MHKKIYLIFLLVIISNLSKADFEPPVIIDPPNPKVGDVIRVGLFVEFYPPCMLLPRENSVGETHLFELNSNDITLNVIYEGLLLCNPIPFEPAPRYYYELGTLEAGEYSLTTISQEVGGFIPEDLPPLPIPNILAVQYGPTLNFTVYQVPHPVDLLTFDRLLIIILLILFSTTLFYRKNYA